MRLVFSSYSAKGLLPSRMGMSGRGKANPTGKEGLYHIRVLGVTSLEWQREYIPHTKWLCFLLWDPRTFLSTPPSTSKVSGRNHRDRFEHHCSGQRCWKPLARFEPPPKQPEHKVSSPVAFLQCLLLKFPFYFHTCYGVPDAVPVFPAAHKQSPGEMRRADPLKPTQHFTTVPSALPSKAMATCWCTPSAPRLSARTSTKLTQTPSQKSYRFPEVLGLTGTQIRGSLGCRTLIFVLFLSSAPFSPAPRFCPPLWEASVEVTD